MAVLAMSSGDHLTLPHGDVSLAAHPVTYQTDWFAYIGGRLVGQQSSSGVQKYGNTLIWGSCSLFSRNRRFIPQESQADSLRF